MSTTFILGLQKKRVKMDRKRHVLAAIIKFFNAHNRFVKLKFKNDNLNRVYKIKNSGRFDSKENMLDGDWTSVEQAVNIYHLLTQTVLLNIPGEVVELGCYEGTTAILMQQTLDQHGSKKKLHVYDSFEGLPAQNQSLTATPYFLQAVAGLKKKASLKTSKNTPLKCRKFMRAGSQTFCQPSCQTKLVLLTWTAIFTHRFWNH